MRARHALKNASSLLLLIAAVGVFALISWYAQPVTSIELGLSMSAPSGPEVGGLVMPASCPSYAHSSGECNAVSAAISCGSPVERGSSTTCTWSCNVPPSTSSWSGGSTTGIPSSATYFNVNNALSGTMSVNPNLVLQAAGSQVGTVTYAVGCGYAWDGSSSVASANVVVTHPAGSCTSGDCTPDISCTPSTINPGQSASCSWQCKTGDTSSSGSNFVTGGGTSGSKSVSPLSTTSYGVQCNNSGESNFASVTVVSPTMSISASPSRVRSGTASTISWSATNVESCSVTGPSFSASGRTGSQSSGAITAQSVYTLTCQLLGEGAGTQSMSVTVSLIPTQVEI